MTIADDVTTAWLRRYHPNPGRPVRLVCFPHAGGSASFYHPVSAAHRATADVVCLQYPGRQDRRLETCHTSIASLADAVVAELRVLSPKPTVFFGHSMGAILAYEAALRLERTLSGPHTVVASGRRAPSTVRAETVHARDDEGVITELRRLNGTVSGLLGDDEILRMALPAIRADYEAIETYRGAPDARLKAGITVLTGHADPLTTTDEAAAWQRHTAGPFRMAGFPGGHFFIAAHQAAVNAEIARDLAAAHRAAVTPVG
ncbi:thioesterase II family protein [Couchioplanes caeruleus]|uniref:AceTE n=2 Tax=Couchioplanes caeruleus TaxID=56438 RepID=A0A1K0GG62_9ACTN|nr:alpha/beta fold hydrolase [Couchioplanes caeruleus]OJF16274.1 AceTE [Couchioplanes caeruleus subsp. caeruleus]ROP28372.1 surfactin synthase thioesterase subunit [Couchioplanes caeruleus]